MLCIACSVKDVSALKTAYCISHSKFFQANGTPRVLSSEKRSATRNRPFGDVLIDAAFNELGLRTLGCNRLLVSLWTAAPASRRAGFENQVERGLLLDVVVGKGAAVFQLFASKDQTLRIRLLSSGRLQHPREQGSFVPLRAAAPLSR